LSVVSIIVFFDQAVPAPFAVQHSHNDVYRFIAVGVKQIRQATADVISYPVITDSFFLSPCSSRPHNFSTPAL
jgi:hypothetical protein